jgi:hypothetical protein
MMPKEIFLSHSDQDRKFVTKIANTIQRHGIPVWYSRKNLVGAQQWHDEIGAALISLRLVYCNLVATIGGVHLGKT